MNNIIVQIEEAERKAAERMEAARNEGIKIINELKNGKERYLAEIEKNIEPKIKKLEKETEKAIQGAKMLHKQTSEKKLRELDEIPAAKLEEAVGFVMNKLTRIVN